LKILDVSKSGARTDDDVQKKDDTFDINENIGALSNMKSMKNLVENLKR